MLEERKNTTFEIRVSEGKTGADPDQPDWEVAELENGVVVDNSDIYDNLTYARIVLMKSYDDRGFVFYTNYNSRKGAELTENPRACLLFYWSLLWRQVRIEGAVEKVSAEESEQYFHSRPLGSKTGAWASNQSQPIANRTELEKRFEEFDLKFADNVPRPPHWGGYRVIPEVIEFWQGQENRLHDRLRYTRQTDDSWLIERLAP